MDLYREGKHIVDVENSTIYTKGSSVTFNFEKMYMYNNNSTSTPRPIMFNGENVLCWVSKSWKPWKDEGTQKAINSLFHACADRELLK